MVGNGVVFGDSLIWLSPNMKEIEMAKTQNRVGTATPMLMNEFDMAHALGVSIHFLRKDRRTTKQVPFIKLGDLVRYDVESVMFALRTQQP